MECKIRRAESPLRVNVILDPDTGAVLTRSGFQQLGVVDRLVSVGVAAHEGQLFGWPNQLLGVLMSLGALLLSITAPILWWRRRADGVLGASLPTGPPRFSTGLPCIIVILGVLFPMFGVSLIAVLVLERLAFDPHSERAVLVGVATAWIGRRCCANSVS